MADKGMPPKHATPDSKVIKQNTVVAVNIPKNHHSASRYLLLAAIILVVIGILIAAFTLTKTTKENTISKINQSKNDKLANEPLSSNTVEAINNHSRMIENSTSYKQAIDFLNRKLVGVKDSTLISQVNAQQAYLSLNVNQNDVALKYARQADSAHPDSISAYALYKANLNLGNTAEAKKYLQIVIDRLDKTSAGYTIEAKRYKEELQGIGG